MAPDPNLHRLHEAGVSVWLDTLSRRLLESGQFAELIRDYNVTGATSNPTIFAKAIIGSDLYDEQLRRLVAVAGATRRSCSSRSRWMTFAEPLGCFDRNTTAAGGSTGSSRSSARRTSPTTPTRRSPRQSICGSASIGPT
jgi:hypothetical protein